MSQSELLTLVVKSLDASGCEYMLTGSLVSSLQGEPRSTHDIDVVVAALPHNVSAFLQYFPDDEYYFDAEHVDTAMQEGGMFNIISVFGGKIDIWALTDSEFDRQRFSRRYAIELFGLKVYVSSPEDTILMKLLWAKQIGGSEKQLFDAAKVYVCQYEILDHDYIASWLHRLGLQSEFSSMHRFCD